MKNGESDPPSQSDNAASEFASDSETSETSRTSDAPVSLGAPRTSGVPASLGSPRTSDRPVSLGSPRTSDPAISLRTLRTSDPAISLRTLRTSDPPASGGPISTSARDSVIAAIESAPVSKATRTKPLLVVERLSKVFPVRRGLFGRPQFLHAVEDVSFYLRRGETLGIVGESGSGKSTLARAVLRLTEPTFGRVLFDDREVTRMSLSDLRPLRRRMQIVFQDPSAALNPRMTVRECVGEGISIFRMAKDNTEADSLVEKALGLVGLLPETMGRYPHELSGGQKQRVGIARALAVRPELLVCDEPVSALDVSIQAQILNLLMKLQKDLGLAMLFISHDLRVIAHTSHRIAVMFLGRIVEMGPTFAVAEKRYHPYSRALFDAVPRFGPEARTKLPIVTDIAGETPSAVDPPKGCVYVTRCPRAEKGKCDVDAPLLSEVVPGSHHRVACWHPEV